MGFLSTMCGALARWGCEGGERVGEEEAWSRRSRWLRAAEDFEPLSLDAGGPVLQHNLVYLNLVNFFGTANERRPG